MCWALGLKTTACLMLLKVTYVRNSSLHIRTDFAFPLQHLIIVFHFTVEVKQNDSTGKCVEESKIVTAHNVT